MRDWVRDLAADHPTVGGEWYHPQTGETLDVLADDLVGHGLTEDQARDILERAYSAVANEFGG